MTTAWTPTRLGNLVRIKHGWPFKSKYFSEGLSGKPIVVAVGNFRYDGGFRFEETATKEYLDSYPEEYELEPGEILLVMTCQTQGGEILGIPGRIPNDGRTYLHNQRLGKVIIEAPELIDRDYLYHVFRSGAFNRELCATASGSKILHTAPSRIEAFEFKRPPTTEQRAIANVIGALDDKLEQNRCTSRALEKLARAIFRAWFVDFEPVKAKAAGASAFPSMPQPVFDALPTRLKDSDIGPVPDGWEVGAISDLATISKTQLKPQQSPEEVFDHFSIPAFDAGMRPAVDTGSTIKSSKFLVIEGSVLLSKLNPRISRAWLPPIPRGRKQIASTEFLVFVPIQTSDRHYVYCQFQQTTFRENLTQGASGTSNSHQRVRPDDVLNRPVVVPPGPTRAAFAGIADPLFALVSSNHEESAKLAKMRDYLLHKLLSGEVRVDHTHTALAERA